MTPAARVLCERLAEAVDYPREGYGAVLEGCRAAARAASPEIAARIDRFRAQVAGLSLQRLQEMYVDAFDLDPGCALDVGWHLYGERRERGELLASLRRELRAAGIEESGELPDHLTHVLLLIARLPDDRGAAFAALAATALGAVLAALRGRETPYVDLVEAIHGLCGPSVATVDAATQTHVPGGVTP